MLVPVTRTQLPPTVVTVPGPGPSESHERADTPPLPDAAVPSKPTPPIPPASSENISGENGDDGYDEDGEADVDDEPRGRANGDPYSNLDGAFGNYLADEPRPMNAGGRQGDEDDLLF